MARPGVIVTSRAEPPPRSAPTEAGMAFIVGQALTGDPVGAVSSMTAYETKYGARTGVGIALHDAVEVFFREGGTNLTVAKLATADDDGLTDALGLLNASMGPGQVLVAGALAYASDTHQQLIDHAAATNRIALLDAAPDSDAGELAAITAAFRAGPSADDGRYAALFGPGAIVPGVVANTTRTVNYSAVQAGIISRNDAAMSANVAAAGVAGQSRFALDLSATFTDAERETLNTAGVNIARAIPGGGVRTYGYRTIADPASPWSLLTSARLNMEIVALCEQIGEEFVFSQLDGRGIKISEFGAALSGMLVPFYEAGALYGATAADAFYVDVGPQVNTIESIAAGELHAVVALRMSPFAEFVVIELVKTSVETSLAFAPVA